MAVLSEEDIVRKLKDERWLYHLLNLKQLDLWQDVYVGSEYSRKADLVGTDNCGKIYAFEVKGEGSNIGLAFDQACDYCMGANFVYCILSKDSVSAPSKEKLEKTGVGLLLYETRKGVLLKPRLEIESAGHDGPFIKIQKGYRGKYIQVHILFVCKTERLNVENEIEIWLKIYKWIEDKKDELLRRYEIEDRSMIVLYPRFINFKECRSLKCIDRAILDRNKIVWYDGFQSIR